MPAKYPIEFETEGSGSFVLDVAGENLGKHKLVYRGADSKWYLADANMTTTMPVMGLTLGIIAANTKGEILLTGYVADLSWTWVVGGNAGLIYGSATPGELTQTIPPLPTDEVQAVAVSFSASSLFFNPSGFLSSGVKVNPESEADYVVWTSGGTYYARNGHTGQVTSNADFNILDATLPHDNQFFQFKDGVYEMEDYTIIAENFILRGSGNTTFRTKIPVSHYQNTVIIQNSTNVTLENIIIDGNADALANIGNMEYKQCGIVVDNTNGVYFNHVYFTKYRQNGLYINEGTVHVVVNDCDFYYGNTGLLAYNGGFGVVGPSPYDITITKSRFTYNDYYESTPTPGVYLSNQTSKTTISECFFSNNNQDIRLDNATHINIESNRMQDTDTYAIYFTSNGASHVNINKNFMTNSLLSNIYLQKGSDNKVTENTFEYGGDYNVRIVNNPNLLFSGNHCLDSLEYNVVFTDCDYLICTKNIVKNTGTSAANTYPGISLTNCDYGTILENISGIVGETQQKYAISLITCTYIRVTENFVWSASLPVIKETTDTGCVIKDNNGFVTENSGTATILNTTTSIVVTHGLSYTPTAQDIFITPTATCTNDPGMIWVNTITATQFTVNCLRDPGASGLAFGWSVRRT